MCSGKNLMPRSDFHKNRKSKENDDYHLHFSMDQKDTNHKTTVLKERIINELIDAQESIRVERENEEKLDVLEEDQVQNLLQTSQIRLQKAKLIIVIVKIKYRLHETHRALEKQKQKANRLSANIVIL